MPLNLLLLSRSDRSVADFDIHFRNSSGINVSEPRLLETARFVMAAQHLSPRTELNIGCVTLSEMERLHIQHMDEPGATDVLSFPMDELRAGTADAPAARGMLGDIVLCPEFAAPQAAAAGHSTADELDLLLTHGILHLLGHDHLEPEEHAVMFGLQAELLSALALTRGGNRA
jgi:probable rRNA maturation factor